jgi:hypothetical protein
MILRIDQAKAAIAVVGLCGLFGLVAPAMAQNTSGDMNKSDGSKTGVGQRGTKVGPSTEPGMSDQSTGGGASQTGNESRGSRTAPPSNEQGTPTAGH